MKKSFISIFAILVLIVGTFMSITMLSSAELQGTVLYESSSSFSKTAKAGKVGSWFKQVTAIRADIIANGAIHPDQGEYYEVVVTGYVSSGSASIYLGENVSWEEYHGTGESLTTTEKTVTWIIPKQVWGVEGEIYVCDSGDLEHTITGSYLKVSVYRQSGDTTSSDVDSDTTSETSATPSDVISDTPSDVTSETTSTTTPAPRPTMYGDAHLDSVVDMKDVLAIRKYIANAPVDGTFNALNADANADGDIDMKDVLAVRKHIAKIEFLPDVPDVSDTNSDTSSITSAITSDTSEPTSSVDPTLYNDYPDQIVASIYNSDATAYGITWHTYNEGGNHVLQYMKLPEGTTNIDFANATSVNATTEPYETLTMPYDLATNLFNYGFDIQTVNDYSHKAAMTNLDYDSTYVYRVGDPTKDIWSQVGTLKTRPQSVSDFSFIWMSDTQVGTATDVTPYSYMLNALVGATQNDPNPAFLFNGGDIVQSSKYLHLWRSQLNGNKDFLLNLPMMPVTGNHDAIYDVGGDHEIIKHFNLDYPEENNVPQYGMFYSFDYGPAHFTVLNTDCFKSSNGQLDETQLAWVQSDVQNSNALWKIVVMHRPMFAIRQADTPAHQQQLLKLFNDNNVDLVLQAHEHCYMRSYPIDGNGTVDINPVTATENNVEYFVNPNGVTFFTCATGGLDGKAPLDEADKSFCYAYAKGQSSSFANISIAGDKLTISSYYRSGESNIPYTNGTWGIKKAPS